jgi:hypothetical protein
VRAVVAAGWAVHDEAARTFAKAFYASFLRGVPFGEAVKAARLQTRETHPDVNTWGAYQCYGNADYSFRRVDQPAEWRYTPVIVARSEALQALRTLAGDARHFSVGALRAQFDALEKALDKRWVDGEILHACGEVCGEIGDFARAIEFYDLALKSRKARAPFVAAEQLANLLARSAATPNASPDAASVRAAAFDRALKILEWLDSRLGKTDERCAIRGSVFKRRAVWEPGRRRQHVLRSVRAYEEARRLSTWKNYSALNYYATTFALASRKRLRALRLDVDAFQNELAQRASEGPRDFWHFAETGDVLLLRSVIHAALDAPAAAKVRAALEQARRIGPSPREWASVCDQLAFLTAMTSDDRLPCFNQATAETLKEIAAAFDVAAGAEPAGT